MGRSKTCSQLSVVNAIIWVEARHAHSYLVANAIIWVEARHAHSYLVANAIIWVEARHAHSYLVANAISRDGFHKENSNKMQPCIFI
jgi:hypothetical protein